MHLGKLVVLKVSRIVGTYAYMSELLLRTELTVLHWILNIPSFGSSRNEVEELICKFKICGAIHKPK